MRTTRSFEVIGEFSFQVALELFAKGYGLQPQPSLFQPFAHDGISLMT